MHHVVLDRWSRGQSLMHRRDPRAKIVVLFAFLLAAATTPHDRMAAFPLFAVLPLAVLVAGRLPLGGALLRAGAVLPFCAFFAIMSIVEGDYQRAAALVGKSYLSALAVLAVAGTTPLPRLLRGLESLGAPRFLLLVIQFLHRYLFVISEQAQHMRLAAASRGSAGGPRFRRWRLRAAAGALAVLFAKSYGRAESTYRAMLSRSFDDRVHLLAPLRLTWGDVLLMVLGVLGSMGLRISLEVLA